MNTTQWKLLQLDYELYTALRLIDIGINELENTNTANDFYFIAFQLLSTGFERLMKTYFCVFFFERNQNFPTAADLKNLGGSTGHDLEKIQSFLLEKYFKKNNARNAEYDFLANDPDLSKIIEILSKFSKNARYHNFNYICAPENKKIDPLGDTKEEWKRYESSKFIDLTLKVGYNPKKQEELIRYKRQHSILIIKRFVRNLGRQFSIGQTGSASLMLSVRFKNYATLFDRNLTLPPFVL